MYTTTPSPDWYNVPFPLFWGLGVLQGMEQTFAQLTLVLDRERRREVRGGGGEYIGSSTRTKDGDGSMAK